MIDSFLQDYTVLTVLTGSGLLGLLSGMVGCFAFLRKRSLVGDAIAHATLPGLCLAFLITGARNFSVLLLGAALSGWLAMVLMSTVIRTTRIKEDSALGIMLSVFFGIGIVLLTVVQKVPNATQAGLDKFLFGQAAALLQIDVLIIGVGSSIVLALLLLFWKELKVFSFDPAFTQSIGFSPRILDLGITTLIVAAIVFGLQAVGVVLMSAMIVAPAAAARQWTDRLGTMVLLAGFVGALGGGAGTLVSTYQAVPTGPAIILCTSAVVAISLLFAPNRGLVWLWGTRRSARRKLKHMSVLLDMYELARQHPNLQHAHSIAVLEAMDEERSAGGNLLKAMHELSQRSLVRVADRDCWALTSEGINEAQACVSAYFGAIDEQSDGIVGG